MYVFVCEWVKAGVKSYTPLCSVCCLLCSICMSPSVSLSLCHFPPLFICVCVTLFCSIIKFDIIRLYGAADCKSACRSVLGGDPYLSLALPLLAGFHHSLPSSPYTSSGPEGHRLAASGALSSEFLNQADGMVKILLLVCNAAGAGQQAVRYRTKYRLFLRLQIWTCHQTVVGLNLI